MANNFDGDVNVDPLATVTWQDQSTSPVTNLLKVGYTAVDPNGVRSGPVGSLLSGPAGLWRNTDGATAWVDVATGSGSDISALTGPGTAGDVVQPNDPAFNGIVNCNTWLLPFGNTITIAPNGVCVIRAKTSITVAGFIDGFGVNPNADKLPYWGKSQGSGSGGGGAGGGAGGAPGQDGDVNGNNDPYLYGGGSSGNAGTGGVSNGGNGTNGTAGTPATIAPPVVTMLAIYPGIEAMVLGGQAGNSGASGGNGSAGFTGGAAGGTGGNGGAPGAGGGLVLLIAPTITLQLGSGIDVTGGDGAGAPGGFAPGSPTVGAPGAGAGDDGGGGGAGGSGGSGGTGGFIGIYGNTVTNGATLSAAGGFGGGGTPGRTGGLAGAGGVDGGDGGNGAAGVSGSAGQVILALIA